MGDRRVMWPVKTNSWYFGGGGYLTGALHIRRVLVVTTTNFIITCHNETRMVLHLIAAYCGH